MRLLVLLTSLFSLLSASLSPGSTPQRYSSEGKSEHGSESDVRNLALKPGRKDIVYVVRDGS